MQPAFKYNGENCITLAGVHSKKGKFILKCVLTQKAAQRLKEIAAKPVHTLYYGPELTPGLIIRACRETGEQVPAGVLEVSEESDASLARRDASKLWIEQEEKNDPIEKRTKVRIAKFGENGPSVILTTNPVREKTLALLHGQTSDAVLFIQTMLDVCKQTNTPVEIVKKY